MSAITFADFLRYGKPAIIVRPEGLGGQWEAYADETATRGMLALRLNGRLTVFGVYNRNVAVKMALDAVKMDREGWKMSIHEASDSRFILKIEKGEDTFYLATQDQPVLAPLSDWDESRSTEEEARAVFAGPVIEQSPECWPEGACRVPDGAHREGWLLLADAPGFSITEHPITIRAIRKDGVTTAGVYVQSGGLLFPAAIISTADKERAAEFIAGKVLDFADVPVEIVDKANGRTLFQYGESYAVVEGCIPLVWADKQETARKYL